VPQSAAAASPKQTAVNAPTAPTIDQSLAFATLRAWTSFTETTQPGAAKPVLPAAQSVSVCQYALLACRETSSTQTERASNCVMTALTWITVRGRAPLVSTTASLAKTKVCAFPVISKMTSDP